VNPGVVGGAGAAAQRYAARKSGLSALAGEPPKPGSPLPSASSLRWPFRSTPGPAILSFKRSSFTPSPE
jgi:hypothetical protein